MESGKPSGQRVLVVAPQPECDQIAAAVRGGGHEVKRVSGQEPPPAAEVGVADLMVLHRRGSEADQAADLVTWLRRIGSGPILAIFETPAPGARERVLEAGAGDVLEGSYSDRELRLRMNRLFQSRASVQRLEGRVGELERRVKERDIELEDARVAILERLARAAEYRDDETGEHARRVGALASALAEGMGFPAEQVRMMRRAAPLHDVGKIGVPDGILLKPGRLTRKEIEVMQAHTGIGARILSGTNIGLLNMAATIALTHHEHWDGNGYPEGKRGDDIPLVGRIVAVADVFDALTTKRPYKRAWPLEEAVAELEAQRGRHLDPDVTEVALSLVLRDALPVPIREHVSSAAGREA